CAADGRLIFTDPGTYNPTNPDPSYIHALAPDGTARVVVAFPEPVFPNGLVVEADGSIVWGESYTGHVRRWRPAGAIEDLGRMPGANPVLDGMKIGGDGRGRARLQRRAFFRRRALACAHPRRRRADPCRRDRGRRPAMNVAAIPA